MTDDVDMQADPDNFPTSSSDQSILDLKNVDLDRLTLPLRNHSENFDWLILIQNDLWDGLLNHVLLALTSTLAGTILARQGYRSTEL